MANDEDKESPLWLTVVKLIIGAIILIGGTGLALWYVDQKQSVEAQRDPATSGKSDWGVAKDSPIHRLH